ncbi:MULTISPECIES: hypothetical protein [Spirulina sp. CCY15215]|nr:hypothetical protein [Spirulina major]
MSQIDSQIEECDRRNYFILNLFCFTLNSLDNCLFCFLNIELLLN